MKIITKFKNWINCNISTIVFLIFLLAGIYIGGYLMLYKGLENIVYGLTNQKYGSYYVNSLFKIVFSLPVLMGLIWNGVCVGMAFDYKLNEGGK